MALVVSHSKINCKKAVARISIKGREGGENLLFKKNRLFAVYTISYINYYCFAIKKSTVLNNLLK